MKRRKISVLCGLAVSSAVVLATAGCAQTTTDTTESQTQNEVTESSTENTVENTFAYTDDSLEYPVSTILTGIVESIDGNGVTLTIGMGGYGLGQGSEMSGETAF
ncbi:MAG: hypothetical protein LUI10_02665 [Lachnospiraceae bacterium]|nr:hypothetical protein [Lachnospiraceae bacterium]